MSYLIKPINYRPLLDMKHTELGIKQIKEFFQQNLSSELRLRRVTAPLFVLKGMGINDDLSGTERPVSFPIKDLGEAQAEVVHSLAKWKRVTLADYEIGPGYGIYTDMNAIRADEELGNLHSLYVDQWDWERVITPEQRTVAFLKSIVTRIYAAMRRTEYMICEMYPQIESFLPHDIQFIHAEELLQIYPDKTAKERENLITEKYGAVFIIGIGGKLSNGQPNDMRAPDYDDYSTIDPETGLGRTERRFAGVEQRAGPFYRAFVDGYPCGQGCSDQTAGALAPGGTHETVFPQTLARRLAAAYYRWRYRTVALVYALSAERSHRRNSG